MIVFTNGCFDLLHPGHVDLLERARRLGTRLIVGLNSDRSVRATKGPGRPFVNEADRKAVLLGLSSVDEVIIFDEATPERLIGDIKPDVLVKGGDWKITEIIGADFVIAEGGQVHSLPLKDNFSSSSIVDKIRDNKMPDQKPSKGTVDDSFKEHLQVIDALLRSQAEIIEKSAVLLQETFTAGRKVLLCGNGGSAADAQHIAAEFVGRFETERRALPAIALTTDTSALTALANDYDAERIFSRQVEALANEGDCLVAISTSGNSPNVIAAVMEARKRGCTVVGLTGQTGKKLAALCDLCVMVPSIRTARVQECHITTAHIWCELVDKSISASIAK
ncbi:MAG: SIS domain-containing protein [Pyrinomonadaceae bacterium]